jgi:hypothetical protein
MLDREPTLLILVLVGIVVPKEMDPCYVCISILWGKAIQIMKLDSSCFVPLDCTGTVLRT